MFVLQSLRSILEKPPDLDQTFERLKLLTVKKMRNNTNLN